MPDSRPPSRLRHKFAAFSIVGALMIMLPLVQVLRYQTAEVQAVLAERAALDPMAHAVAVQRALLTHRDLAGRVLRGRPAFEPERKRSQGDVDARLATLAGTLAAGPWERALEESNALGEDWQQLAREVVARRITAAESDQAHRLRVEQTLQVIDHVAATLVPPDAADLRTAGVPAQTLPRMARQIATLATAGNELDALAANSADAANAAALHALRLRFDETRQRQALALEQHAALLEGHRNLLLAAMAALLAVAVLLAGRLVRTPAAAAPDGQGEPATPAAPATATAGPSSTLDTTHRLLQRLRHGDTDTQLRSAGMASGSAALPPVTDPGKATSD